MKMKVALVLVFMLLVGLSLARAQDPAPENSFSNDWVEIEWDAEAEVFIEDITAHSGAFAEAVGSSVITGNVLHEENTRSQSIIKDSFNDNRGMVNMNQASGSLNNQSIIRAISFVADPDALNMTQEVDAQQMGVNTLVSINVTSEDIIENSFNNNVGIFAVNQSSGNLNIQTDIIAIAIGGAVAISDASLAQINVVNTVEEENVSHSDVIRNSFKNFRGIVQLAQSAGNMNMQRNALAFSVMELNIR